MVDPVISVTAEIIQFPTRKPAAAPTAAPAVPGERLSTALAALSTALSDQQTAVQRWREAMDELASCMQRLSGGMQSIKTSPPPAG